MRFRSGEIAGADYHKKPAYLLGIKAFCIRYLNGMKPGFWNFRIGKSTYKVWEEATGLKLYEDEAELEATMTAGDIIVD